jgi:hemolysin III
MRGWLHLWAFGVSVICAAVLVPLAAFRPGWAPLVSCSIYSLTVCASFGVSALYHRRIWGQRGYALMKRLDHATIFVLIAGTYTPFCVLLLPAPAAARLLTIVWVGAAAGVALKLAWPHGPSWVGVPLYIALGWVAVVALPDFMRHGGVTTLVLCIIGGVAYSVGAVFYAIKRPNPWPAVFEHHELFHACTLVAAVCFHVAAYFSLYA